MKSLLAFAAGALVSMSASVDARTVTVDDLMTLRTILDVRISPDGKNIVYAVSTPSMERNAHEAAIYLEPTVGGPPRRLAETARIAGARLPTPKLRWSPDSSRVSFLALSADKPQVFAISTSGGTASALTAAPEGVSGYEWSPDGRSLAYLARDPLSDERQRERNNVIHADQPDPPTRLWLQPLAGAPARALSSASQYVDSLSWSPGGEEIAYSAAPTSGFQAQYMTRIFAVPIAGGSPRTVIDRSGMNTSPQFSPDGKWIAFVSTGGRAEIMAPRSLTIASARGGPEAPRAFGLHDAWVSDLVWAPDSRSIYLLTTDGTYARAEHMFEQPLVRVWIGDGRAEKILGAVNYSPSLSRDASRMAYRRVDARTMGDIFVRDTADGKTIRRSDINPELRQFELGDLAPIHWRSFDGFDVWGLLLTPPHAKAGEKLPLIVYCHGGPNGGVTYGIFPQFMQTVGQIDPYPAEAMAAAGYAIFFPMPRGGSGYGEAGQRVIVNGWGEVDYKDVMTGVDDLIARGIADPERLGVMGASYGGYLTEWIVTQTARFKAASAGEAVSDLADEYFLSDGAEVMAEYFRRPWEAPDSYLAHSPLHFARNVTTPLLIQHGERDLRVPIANAWKFYRELKSLGKTVELDVHPRSSHLSYEPAVERESMKRNLDWFEKWIPTAPR